MEEVPAFVKKIVATAVGTKPYIYQVGTHSYTFIVAGHFLYLPGEQGRSYSTDKQLVHASAEEAQFEAEDWRL